VIPWLLGPSSNCSAETGALVVHNNLEEPTSIHWHGLEIEVSRRLPNWTGWDHV
jgi:hypothetical protein